MEESFWQESDIIFKYTRKQAIEDGVLFPVDEKICKEAGISLPVCVTTGVAEFLDPGNLQEMPGQSFKGRLWDLLSMFVVCARGNKDTDRIYYPVIFQMKPGKTVNQETVKIYAVVGPGDEGEPVITLMLPHED